MSFIFKPIHVTNKQIGVQGVHHSISSRWVTRNPYTHPRATEQKKRIVWPQMEKMDTDIPQPVSMNYGQMSK